jgi:sugar/nucleoside kinase (ribokinase family)
LVAVGAIGSGLFFALEGNHTLARNESRAARWLDVRDYCKLHIIAHYVSVLLGGGSEPGRFHVLPIGRIGEDDVGRQMVNEMAAAGMDVRAISTTPGRPTTFGVCFQYPDGDGGNITASDSAAALLCPADVDAALPLLRLGGDRYIAVAAPEIPHRTRMYFLRRASEMGAFCAACVTSADAASGEARELADHADLVAMNEDEAATWIGCPFEPDAPARFLATCAEAMSRQSRRVQLVVSAGPHGAFAYDGNTWEHRPAPAVPVASTAGAGDALLAGVLSGLAVGMPLVADRNQALDRGTPFQSALMFAVTLAAFTVTSPHSIHPECSLEQVLRLTTVQSPKSSDEFACRR